MIKPIERILHSFLLLVFIGASGSIVYYIKTTSPAPRPIPAVTLTSGPTDRMPPAAAFLPTSLPDPSSAAEPLQASGWSLLKPGLERRVMRVYNEQNQQAETLYMWRLDQKYFRMDVAFNETPWSLDTWQKETNAALVVNGGYFSINNKRYLPDGLTVLHSQASGKTFSGFGGMLAIHEDKAELRWLVEKPYNPAERLQAALQSFPILVEPGGKLGFPDERDNQARARRTVIAQDKKGRILFLIAPNGYFTLHQLSVYLTESDLNLDIALNLDGGGSTGILVAKPREMISSGTLLPFVILVYPR